MHLPRFATALAFALCSTFAIGCVDEEVDPEVRAPVHHRADVPFRGHYVKVGESTYKNGHRVRMANNDGAATVRVDRGRVTYDQTYMSSSGELRRVVQVYSFTPADVHAASPGDFEVALTFRRMSGDVHSYSPDRHDPRLEAHRDSEGWRIDLLTTDNNGVVGVAEFH